MSGGSSAGNGPCGACKFLRRKCVPGCIFAPYFDSDQGAAHFAAVHKVFGASNVSKLISNLPVNKRLDAVVTVCYEAQARMRDPVYGCVSHIFALQQQVVSLQAELSYMHAHLASLELPPPPPLQSQQMTIPMSSLLTADVALSSSLSYDLISQSEPEMLQHLSWGSLRQQQQVEQRQHGGSSSQVVSAGNELQALACDLISRHLSGHSNPTVIPKRQ